MACKVLRLRYGTDRLWGSQSFHNITALCKVPDDMIVLLLRAPGGLIVSKTSTLSDFRPCLVERYSSCWPNAGDEPVDDSWGMIAPGSIAILQRFTPSCNVGLGFDFVFSLEHLIDFGQIIGPLGNGLGVALGRVTLLQMCLFSK